ncbi:hypothetical protein ACVW00_000641 [Marmoricola sp. URHA0025 HA25]
MNTSESLPDGVWFRNSPSQNDTNRETGFGVYMNEQVQAHCYAFGDAVGPYGNRVWYYATNLTRPTVNGHANVGYINTHYVNDGMTANNVYPGITQCGSGGGGSTPPPTPPPANIYYSPYNAGDTQFAVGDASVATVQRDEWVTGTCGNSGPAYSAAMSKLQSGQTIQTLAGWSIGRTGIAYFLRNAAQSQLTSINYMLMIDPGAYGEMDCDRAIAAGRALANWLAVNRNAHLVVISSYQVSQQQSSKGIQQTYFNDIRNLQSSSGIDLRSRVLVCNYGTKSTFSHQEAFWSGRYWISHQIGSSTSSCPWLNYNGVTWKPTAQWHP